MRFPIHITPEELYAVNSVLEQICWRCHMMHHSRHRNPVAVDRYFDEIAEGKMYPPVHKPNWGILKRDHGV